MIRIGAVGAARHLDVHLSLVGAPPYRFATGDFIRRVEQKIAAALVSHH